VSPDAIVIGGGLAGLSAATALAERGRRVLVLEARPSLGGRATAFTDPATGERVDNGQHALFGCYHETFSFLEAIGARDRVRLERVLDLQIVDAASARSRLTAAALPAPFHLAGGLLGWRAIGWGDRLAAVRLGLRLRREARRDAGGLEPDPQWSQRTVDEWLIANGQTRRLRELLWEPLAVAALNQSPAVAAAAPFVRVASRLLGGSPRDAAIGLPATALDEMYATPASQWIEHHGGRVSLGRPARLVAIGSHRVAVELEGERLEAPVVISSVPWFAFPALAAATPALAATARLAGQMASSPIVTVNFWLDRPVTDVAFVGLPGRVFQWIFDKARLVGGAQSHLSLISSGADELVGWSNARLIAHAREELTAALPEAGRATILGAVAVREKRATFSLAPGQPARPGPTTPVTGLLLAGDWTETGLPATIEGAVASGHRAAEHAVRS